MLITGSTALKYWYPDFSRNPDDLDIISPTPSKSQEMVEYHWVNSFEYLLQHLNAPGRAKVQRGQVN